MHTIRLRGPWEVSSSKFGKRKVKQLTEWANLPAEKNDTLVVGRHFNLPTGLEAAQIVCVAVAGAQLPLTVTVNGVRLGDVHPGDRPERFEITPHLQPRNLLQIELTCDPELWPPSADPFELQLEIED